MLALLLLGDGRFPAGGHVHSAGIESAVADGRVTGERSLEAYLRGRLVTVGLTDAALVAATVLRLEAERASAPALLGAVVGELDAEIEARIAPPSLRAASRKLGRQLVRVASRCWPDALFPALSTSHADGVHQPLALGATAVVAGLTPREAATLAVHHAIGTPAQGAVRLLGLDPFAAAALTARLAPEAAAVVSEAVARAPGPLADLPACTGPLCEIAAVAHAARDARLFAT
ncbi:MAG: ureF [Acidimicrobiales bacterium]|nr:ureF [Acidimicrobiales bacterium]